MLNPYNHVDIRVNNMELALPFYTAFLHALSFTGPERIVEPDGRIWQNFRFRSGPNPSQYVGLIEDINHSPNQNCVAFHVPTRSRVTELADVVAHVGTTQLEGPVACPEYGKSYYAVFFTDPSGNRLEVCCHLESDIPGSHPDLDHIVAVVKIPEPFSIQVWSPKYFKDIQRLSSNEGWTTPSLRPRETLIAWEHSWPALVLIHSEKGLAGFLRAITDTQVTTYLGEILIAKEFRTLGLGRILIDVCQRLVPATRLDLLSTVEADDFYRSIECNEFLGFRRHPIAFNN